MNSSVFKIHPLQKRSFLQRLFNQNPEDNAIIELNNLLASSPINEINNIEILILEEKYGIKFNTEFYPNLEEFYATYLYHCLRDNVLSQEDNNQLHHLRDLLSLSEKSIDLLHNMIGTFVYESNFKDAISDGIISPAEKSLLDRLKKELQLPQSVIDKVAYDANINFINEYVESITNDERLSPDKEEKIKSIAKNLNVNLNDLGQTKENLAKFKKYWELENLELQHKSTSLLLYKNEYCYFTSDPVVWNELINKSKYGSPIIREIDKGMLCITNKRIILKGKIKNYQIRISDIQFINNSFGGIEILKDNGKNYILYIPININEFTIILKRLLKK